MGKYPAARGRTPRRLLKGGLPALFLSESAVRLEDDRAHRRYRPCFVDERKFSAAARLRAFFELSSNGE